MNNTVKKVHNKAIEAMNRAKAIKTSKHKDLFIKNYLSARGIVTTAAEMTGVSSEAFYDWVKNDKEFRKKITALEPVLVGHVKDKLLKAINKDNITAIIYYLKHKHPEFRERDFEGIQTGPTTNNLILVMVKPGEKIPKELQEKEIIDVEATNE